MSSNSFMRKKFTLIFFTIQHIFRRTSQNLVSHVVVTTVDKEVAESSFTAYCIQQILVKKMFQPQPFTGLPRVQDIYFLNIFIFGDRVL